jgi:hypothetical protein
MKTARTLPRIFTHFIKFAATFVMLCCVVHATELQGRITDETGAVIAGAHVNLITGQQTYNVISDGSGTFVIPSSSNPGTLQVSAPRFASITMQWNGSASPVSITLKSAAVANTVVSQRNAMPSASGKLQQMLWCSQLRR